MLHVDLPTDDDLRQLAEGPDAPTVTVYLPTTPVTASADADRIAFMNLAREGVEALRSAGVSKKEADTIAEELEDLADDADFWAHQAHGLAVIVSPSTTATFRLPETLEPAVFAGDRARLAPLVAAASSPRAFLVLDLSADGARLLESIGDGTGTRVSVPNKPKSAADHAGKSNINDRSLSGRLVGDEGRNVHLRSYVRAVHSAVRPLLHGEREPLILVATEPLASMYRNVSAYPYLLDAGVSLSADHEYDASVARMAAPLAADAIEADTAALVDLLATWQEVGRAALDPATVARAAVQGAVGTLLVDTTVDHSGSVHSDGTLASAGGPGGLVEDLVRLALAKGGSVRHVAAERLPGGTPVAAILRWAAA
ncbi:MAG: hypothetical protein GC156_09555 [Actinomycetales bacterium]|nr:hypothetical protein [Actinomycetales bacterium]